VQHPNIVQIFDVGEEAGLPYCALELLEGGTLSARVAELSLPFRESARLLETLARAVHAAHQMGIIHRDLKPGNVLFTLDGVPKVADFGLAKRLEEEGQTHTGQILGSPNYMAPEQARGQTKTVGPAADVYALGAILYELLTGHPPFQGATPLETVQLVQTQEPVKPSKLVPRVPRDLETVCLKCLRKEPSQRYSSALELAEDVGRYLRQEPVRARPAGLVERTVRWCRRNPAAAGLIGAVLAIGLALAVIALLMSYNRDLEAAQKAEAEQRGRAETAFEKSDAQAYVHRINVADRLWDEGNNRQALDLLRECPPKRCGWEWHYLYNRCHAEAAVVALPTTVQGVAVSRDGKYLATCGRDGKVRLHDAASRRVLLELDGLVAGTTLWNVVFSPDVRYLAAVTGSANFRGGVRLWELGDSDGQNAIPKAKEKWSRQLVTGLHGSLTFSPDGQQLAVGSGVPGELVNGDQEPNDTESRKTAALPRTVEVLAVSSGERLHTLSLPSKGGVLCVAFAPDGRHLVTGSGNVPLSSEILAGVVQIWELASGREVHRWAAHDRGVQSLAFHPDGQVLVTGGQDQVVKLWNWQTRREEKSWKGHRGTVHQVAFSPDGRRLAAASTDSVVRIWEWAGSATTMLRGHDSEVYSLAWFPDNRRLLSSGNEHVVRLWDIAACPEGRVWTHHQGAVTSVAFSKDNRWLITGGRDRTVQMAEVAGTAAPRLLGRLAGEVHAVEVSPDGKLIAAGSNGAIVCWDTATGQEVRRWQAHRTVTRWVTFSPDGHYLASLGDGGSHAGEITLWEAATGRSLRSASFPNQVQKAAFSPDGQRLAIIGNGQSLFTIWDWTTGRQNVHRDMTGGLAASIAFTPDGQRILTGSPRSISVWAYSLDAIMQVTYAGAMTGPVGNVSSLRFSPDGQRLASASHDQTVRIWDASTGQELLNLRGHSDAVLALAFSPDGHWLASAGQDGQVRLWNGTPSRRAGDARGTIKKWTGVPNTGRRKTP
jgi:WD40 repeat protein